jgi:hypothetical protein
MFIGVGTGSVLSVSNPGNSPTASRADRRRARRASEAAKRQASERHPSLYQDSDALHLLGIVIQQPPIELQRWDV